MLMSKLNKETVTLDEAKLAKCREMFDSYAVSDQVTVETIKQVFDETGYLLDPHTAIGVKAARETRRNNKVPMVTLGTAHPVKFTDAIKQAGLHSPELPHHLTDLFERAERCTVLPNDIKKVHEFVAANVFK